MSCSAETGYGVWQWEEFYLLWHKPLAVICALYPAHSVRSAARGRVERKTEAHEHKCFALVSVWVTPGTTWLFMRIKTNGLCVLLEAQVLPCARLKYIYNSPGIKCDIRHLQFIPNTNFLRIDLASRMWGYFGESDQASRRKGTVVYFLPPTFVPSMCSHANIATLQKKQTKPPRVFRRLFQNVVFSKEISDLGDWSWSGEILKMLHFLLSDFGDWSWSGEILKMQNFLGNSLIWGIGLGLVKLSKCNILWWDISTESRCSPEGLCRACANTTSSIEGMAVAGETVLRGAGSRGTPLSIRPAQPLLLAATTHHCDCCCHRHRPGPGQRDDHHHRRGAIQGKEFGWHPVTASHS